MGFVAILQTRCMIEIRIVSVNALFVKENSERSAMTEET